MDNVLPELVKQIPSLSVLAFLVMKFLVSLKDRDIALSELNKQCHDFQSGMQEKHRENVAVMATALSQNTQALSANTHALGRVESVLDDLDTKISGT